MWPALSEVAAIVLAETQTHEEKGIQENLVPKYDVHPIKKE